MTSLLNGSSSQEKERQREKGVKELLMFPLNVEVNGFNKGFHAKGEKEKKKKLWQKEEKSQVIRISVCFFRHSFHSLSRMLDKRDCSLLLRLSQLCKHQSNVNYILPFNIWFKSPRNLPTFSTCLCFKLTWTISTFFPSHLNLVCLQHFSEVVRTIHDKVSLTEPRFDNIISNKLHWALRKWISYP